MPARQDGETESTSADSSEDICEGILVSRFDDLGPNSGLAEELYQRYLDNPASVDGHWRDYFDVPTFTSQLEAITAD